MIEIKSNFDQIDRAKFYAKTIKSESTDFDQKLRGCLSEILIADFLGEQIVGSQNLDLYIGGKKIDVKSHGTNSKPQESYNHVLELNAADKKCDFLLCCFCLNDLSAIYVAGFIPPLSACRFYKPKGFTTGRLTLDRAGFVVPVCELIEPLILLSQNRFSTFRQ